MGLVMALLILFFSVVLHEVAHGVVALWNGDPTAREMGRLSLNPLRHVDPFGTVLLPLLLVILQSSVLFGWAKPVPINPTRFRHRAFGTLTVGAAGPGMNIALALLFAFGFRTASMDDPFRVVCFYGASINVLLAVFNMLPIPPLDGSRVVGALLSREVRRAYYSLERWGIFIVIALLYLGVIHRVIIPIYEWFLVRMLGSA